MSTVPGEDLLDKHATLTCCGTLGGVTLQEVLDTQLELPKLQEVLLRNAALLPWQGLVGIHKLIVYLHKSELSVKMKKCSIELQTAIFNIIFSCL